jgi:2-dehydro-3-deoxygluconokinase
VTLGAQGALAWHDGRLWTAPAVDVAVVDRVGRGDAFVAGFLCGWLRDAGVAEALRLGCALAALAQTYRGDLVWGDKALVDRVLRGEGVARER